MPPILCHRISDASAWYNRITTASAYLDVNPVKTVSTVLKYWLERHVEIVTFDSSRLAGIKKTTHYDIVHHK